MKVQGIQGERIFVESNAGMYSEKFGTNVSKNGKHHAIKIGDMVYDNMYPKGIGYAEWLYDYGISIIPSEFTIHPPTAIN